MDVGVKLARPKESGLELQKVGYLVFKLTRFTISGFDLIGLPVFFYYNLMNSQNALRFETAIVLKLVEIGS